MTSKVRFRWYKLSKFDIEIFDGDLPLVIPAEQDGVIIGQSMKPTLELSFLKYGKFEIHIHVENNVTKLSKTVLLEIMKPVIVLKGMLVKFNFVRVPRDFKIQENPWPLFYAPHFIGKNEFFSMLTSMGSEKKA